MESMREAWTDERLDDLNGRVDAGFREMREEFREVRREIGGLNARFDTLQQSLNRTILQVGGGLFGTFVVGFIGLAFG